jgi:hypothetical protein
MNPAYKKARLRAEVPLEELPESFWIITVCNPEGVTIPEEENVVRTEAFRAQLVDHGLRHFPVMGYDPDSPHREPGFGVVCERAIALSFGRQWDQEAIFHGDHGEVILVSCGEFAEDCPLGSWVSKADVS